MFQQARQFQARRDATESCLRRDAMSWGNTIFWSTFINYLLVRGFSCLFFFPGLSSGLRVNPVHVTEITLKEKFQMFDLTLNPWKTKCK